jgi:hypothetical protein
MDRVETEIFASFAGKVRKLEDGIRELEKAKPKV